MTLFSINKQFWLGKTTKIVKFVTRFNTSAENPCYPIDTTYYIDNLYEQPINFWFYQLKALPLAQLNRASAIPGLNREDAYKLPIYRPPLNEQKRIVAKIEELNDCTQKAKEALEAIPQLCDRFRQSVLAAAFRGDLTGEYVTFEAA